MNNVILFAGTTEGRMIAEALRDAPLNVYVSVATEYGEAMIEPAENIRVVHGRKNAEEIRMLLRETQAALVIDATHPYAAEVTKAIKEACREESVEYLRVLRKEAHEDTEGSVFVADASEAAVWLDHTEGNVLLTVGSKELPEFAKMRDAGERVFARILSLPDAVRQAAELGFTGRHVIAMQGPFSEELNTAMLRSVDARYLVTKDTGAAGGFPEKIRAARACGVTPVVIKRPLEEEGVSVPECLRTLSERFSFTLDTEKQVTILGVGTGSAGSLTFDADRACTGAELIIGAKRVTNALARFGKPSVNAILPKERCREDRGRDVR